MRFTKYIIIFMTINIGKNNIVKTGEKIKIKALKTFYIFGLVLKIHQSRVDINNNNNLDKAGQGGRESFVKLYSNKDYSTFFLINNNNFMFRINFTFTHPAKLKTAF